MENPLVEHAIRNVWCATNQDFQHHINLPRITPDRGVLNAYPVLWDHLAVPTTPRGKDYFHYYQIGHLPAKTFDFVGKENEWIPYQELNSNNNILIDVYMVSGAIVPRDHIWITQLYNKNIVIAIKNNFRMDYGTCDRAYFTGVTYKDKFTLDNNQLIVRFYSNAYFDKISYRENAVDPNNPVRHVYRTIKSQEDYTNYSMAVSAIESEFGGSGHGIYYQDGFVINKPLGFSDDMIGAHLGFMWDESFKYSKDIPIRHIPTYISEMHRGVRKYLIVTDAVYDSIDYHDDVDLYIVNIQTGKGVYFNRNGRFGLTMITHNSYALNAELVENYIDAHDFLGNIGDCAIRVMIRHGGRDNGLLNQKNRINELYKLPYDDIISAHINAPSLVSSWRAATLEQSNYVKLMSAPSHLIDTDLVVSAYGYNALCSIFANPIVDVNVGEVVVPEIARLPDKSNNLGNRTIFCYDDQGLMIGYYHNASLASTVGIPVNLKSAKTVECFNTNLSHEDIGAWVNLDVESMDLDQYGFRCYVSAADGEGINNVWEDVTDTKLYKYTPGTFNTLPTIEWKWDLLTQSGLYPAVKTNKIMHVYKWSKKSTDVYDGCLEVVVKARQQWGNKVISKPVGIPPANVDVFANGLSLIENVDYFMSWPTIVIINRDINRAKTIDLVVRSYGCGNPITDKPFKAQDQGFVKDGMLSVNGVYDLRKDKCVRVVVDNKLMNVGDMNYGEYQTGGNYTDGKPYSITDYVLPIENLLPGYDTWEMYKEVKDIDESVSGYLSSRLPETPARTPTVNVTRWPVISPVVSSILHAFKNQYNFDELVPDNYTMEDVDTWFKPFKWLLQYDPAHNKVDDNYFRIEPHSSTTVMSVTQKQYEFLEWIISLHLNDRVDLTNNVIIGQ